jgi:hypothetical protein
MIVCLARRVKRSALTDCPRKPWELLTGG